MGGRHSEMKGQIIKTGECILETRNCLQCLAINQNTVENMRIKCSDALQLKCVAEQYRTGKSTVKTKQMFINTLTNQYLVL